jgi:adenosylcobinamide-GDP ribazoletransferase
MRTLTILPVPGKEAGNMADALPWFPLAGFLTGLLVYGISRGIGLVSGDWAGGAAATALVAGVLLTRGFHLDGLADWADGFGGGRDRAHTLAIMKDSRAGPFGVLAVLLALLLKYVALLRLAETGALHLIVPVFIVSRTILVDLSVRLPYARPEGGTAAPFVEGSRPFHRTAALLVALTLLPALSGWTGWILLALGMAASRLLGSWFRRRVGGVTGDLLGAGCELVETGLLFACAAAGGWAPPFPGWRIFPI